MGFQKRSSAGFQRVDEIADLPAGGSTQVYYVKNEYAFYSWNGSAWIPTNSTAGAFSINGLTEPAQTIEIANDGTLTAPDIQDIDEVGLDRHVIRYPLASDNSGVTAGLLGYDDWEKLNSLDSPLQLKGAITTAADFPDPALVETGWAYIVAADVTDDDPTKTNTGQSFDAGQEIAWNGTSWTELGNRNAKSILYDNSTSGLVATQTQAAIDELQAKTNLTKEPTGFAEPDDVIVTGDPTTRTVTLTGTVNAYHRGRKSDTIISGWTSPAHGTDTNIEYFLYWDGSTITWMDASTAGAEFYSNALIALAFYDATAATWVYLRECHGLMQWQGHRADHKNFGTYKDSGGGLSNYTLASTTPADRRPDIASTLIYDEDLPTTNPALVSADGYTQLYIDATGAPIFTTGAADIVPLNVDRPQYNDGGTLTDIANNDYMNMWLLAIPTAADTTSQAYRYAWFVGQSQYAALADAEGESPANLDFGNFVALFPEFVLIQQATIRYTGGDWQISAVKSVNGNRFSQTTVAASTGLTSVSSDTTLTGLGTASSPLGVELTDGINTGGTLSNVAYLDQDNVFTATNVLPVIKPASDSTTAVQITKADGTTAVLNVDTTNGAITTNATGTDAQTWKSSDFTNSEMLIGWDRYGGDIALLYNNNTTTKVVSGVGDEGYSEIVYIFADGDILHTGSGGTAFNKDVSIVGDVGIGTDDIPHPLTILSDGDGIGLRNPGSAGGDSATLIHSSNNGGVLSLYNEDGSLGARIRSYTAGSHPAQAIFLKGNVGIGTDSPSKELYVIGDIHASGEISGSTITDRTPYPESTSLAYDALHSMQRLPAGKYDPKNKEKQLDHSKLHPYLQGKGDDPNRDMSATISVLGEVLKAVDGDIDLLYKMAGETRPSKKKEKSALGKFFDRMRKK